MSLLKTAVLPHNWQNFTFILQQAAEAKIIQKVKEDHEKNQVNDKGAQASSRYVYYKVMIKFRV